MEEEKKPKQKGGRREGAGRKPKGAIGSQLMSFRMNKQHMALIKEHHSSLTEFIDKAVKEKLRREGLL